MFELGFELGFELVHDPCSRKDTWVEGLQRSPLHPLRLDLTTRLTTEACCPVEFKWL